MACVVFGAAMVYKKRHRRRVPLAKKTAQPRRSLPQAHQAQVPASCDPYVSVSPARLPRDAGCALLERPFGVGGCIRTAALEGLHRAQDERRVLQKCVQREAQVPKRRGAHRTASVCHVHMQDGVARVALDAQFLVHIVGPQLLVDANHLLHGLCRGMVRARNRERTVCEYRPARRTLRAASSPRPAVGRPMRGGVAADWARGRDAPRGAWWALFGSSCGP